MQISFVSLIIIFLSIGQSFASAWVPENHDLSIYKFNYYQASESFDANGKKNSIPSLLKYELSLYKEKFWRKQLLYGYDFTFTSEESEGNSNFSDLGRSFFLSEKLFVRYNFFDRLGQVVSSQATMSLPVLYQTSFAQGEATEETLATELRILYGKSFMLGRYHAYINSEIGYNYYWFSPEIRNLKMQNLFGVHLDDDHSVALALYSEKDSQSIWVDNVARVNRNRYDVHRVELSYRYQIQKDRYLSLAFYRDIDGKNTTAGNGIIASFIKEFQLDTI